MTCRVREPVWVAGILALLLVGCSAAQRRENYLRDRAAEYVYPYPLYDIWPRVKGVLESRGYSWREAPGRFVLETEWKENGGGALSYSYTKLLVEGLRLKRGGTLLRVMRSEASSQPAAVNYAGPSGPITSTKAANDAMVDALQTNTTGMTQTQRRAFRDLELEWELLQTIDPESAKALEAEAAARYPK